MNKNQSLTIDYLRIPFTVLVIVLHAYTATQNVNWLNIGHPIYKFITYNLSLLCGYIAVPFFFFISGYLFFTHYFKGKIFYLNKWRKRLYTLLLPYLIWNFLVLLLYYFLQNNALTAPYFSGFHKPIADYNWKEFLQAFWAVGGYDGGDGTPILSPYWYIRNLIILCLFTPAIYKLNVYAKYFWLFPIGLLWICTPRMAFSACSVFWFGIGAYFSIQGKELYSVFRKKINWQIGIWLFLWILFNIFPFYEIHSIVAVVVHRLLIIGAVPIVYIWSYNKISSQKWNINKNLSDSSFFIYTIHSPILLVIRKVIVKLLPGASDVVSVLLWAFSIVVTFLFSYGIYRLMKKFFPHLLSFLCGGHN